MAVPAVIGSEVEVPLARNKCGPRRCSRPVVSRAEGDDRFIAVRAAHLT